MGAACLLCLICALVALGVFATQTPAARMQPSGPRGIIAVGSGSPREIYLISAGTRATGRVVLAPERMFDFDLSPDGRTIAVAGFTGIWVMRRDGSHARRILDGRKLRFAAGQLTWSPDGKRLAFIRDETLFTIAERGKNIRRIRGHAEAPDWSPDNTHIVFVHNPALSSRNGTISTIETNGRGLRRIVATGKWHGPSVSPDGSKVAFDRSGLPGIFIAPTKGGRAKLFLRNGSHPEWSPDGRYLAFTRELDCGEAVCSSRIFVIPAGGGKALPYGPEIVDIGPLSWSD